MYVKILKLLRIEEVIHNVCETVAAVSFFQYKGC